MAISILSLILFYISPISYTTWAWISHLLAEQDLARMLSSGCGEDGSRTLLGNTEAERPLLARVVLERNRVDLLPEEPELLPEVLFGLSTLSHWNCNITNKNKMNVTNKHI